MMDDNFNPFDPLVKEIMDNARYLDSLFTRTRIILGAVGFVVMLGVMVVVVPF